MTLNVNVSGKNINIKSAKQSIELIRELANLQMFEVVDTKSHGVVRYMDSAHRQLRYYPDEEIENSYMTHEIDTYPDRFFISSAFGIRVTFHNDTLFYVQYVRNKKGCFGYGGSECNVRTPYDDEDYLPKREALNNHLWVVHVLEAIQTHLIPELEIADRSNYHKTQPDRATLREWRQSDRHRGTTHEKDFNDIKNHSLQHLLNECDWDISVLTARPVRLSDAKQSARIRQLRSRLNRQEAQNTEYEYRAKLLELIQMVLEFQGIVEGEPQ